MLLMENLVRLMLTLQASSDFISYSNLCNASGYNLSLWESSLVSEMVIYPVQIALCTEISWGQAVGSLDYASQVVFHEQIVISPPSDFYINMSCIHIYKALQSHMALWVIIQVSKPPPQKKHQNRDSETWKETWMRKSIDEKIKKPGVYLLWVEFWKTFGLPLQKSGVQDFP